MICDYICVFRIPYAIVYESFKRAYVFPQQIVKAQIPHFAFHENKTGFDYKDEKRTLKVQFQFKKTECS